MTFTAMKTVKWSSLQLQQPSEFTNKFTLRFIFFSKVHISDVYEFTAKFTEQFMKVQRLV